MTGSPLRIEYLARAVVELVGGGVVAVVVALAEPLGLAGVVVGAAVVFAVLESRVTGPYVDGALRKPGWDPHAVAVTPRSAAIRGALLPLILVAIYTPWAGTGDVLTSLIVAGLLLGDGLASAHALRSVRAWERGTGNALLRMSGTTLGDALQPGWFVWWWGHTPEGAFLAVGEQPPPKRAVFG